MKQQTKHLFSTLLYFLGIALVLILLVFTLTLPHVKADTPRVGGEFILWVTMQNGPGKETLFGGSFPNNQACIVYAKNNYPIDNKRWIEYTCIHEDVHEYLEKMKGKEVLL